MGSEQSTQATSTSKSKSTRIGQLRRGKSVPEPKRSDGDNSIEGSRPGSCSPGLSVCSDSDLPYISYTVNRPIGDSPKLPAKQASHLLRGKSLGATPSALNRKGVLRKSSTIRSHNVVVVKAPSKGENEKDSDVVRLQKIPMFLPIMRGTLNLPAPRDPEILERLDPISLYKLCLRCEKYLNECANLVATDQNQLVNKIKEIDTEVARIFNIIIQRQKAYAKHAENLAKVNDLTAQIAKCHLSLNKTLETIEILNNALPIEDRLEPFVWTTG